MSNSILHKSKNRNSIMNPQDWVNFFLTKFNFKVTEEMLQSFPNLNQKSTAIVVPAKFHCIMPNESLMNTGVTRIVDGDEEFMIPLERMLAVSVVLWKKEQGLS